MYGFLETRAGSTYCLVQLTPLSPVLVLLLITHSQNVICVSPAFPCHENGATVLQYAPKQQLLISGGRKGFVCVFDIRQRQLLHTFQAHDSAVKALALDASEDFFVTGSAEGNMKVIFLITF